MVQACPNQLGSYHVRYAIIPPGKERHDPQVPFRLWRGGQQVDSWRYQVGATNLFRSLPLGHYRLVVPGTAEQRRTSSRGLNEIIPPTRGYRGREITFAITEQSPKVIDAGVMRLESE